MEYPRAGRSGRADRAMTLPETTTPEELARHMGWAPKRVRRLAKRLGACRILGNRMALMPEDVQTILEATKPCPSKSIGVREALSGITEGRLPEIDSVALLAHLTKKPRRELRPRLKTSSGNVGEMKRLGIKIVVESGKRLWTFIRRKRIPQETDRYLSLN